MERIGIFGGTFDPIHNGHLAIAEEARWALGLARLYMVPAARQPLKDSLPGASADQRYEMVRLACINNPAFLPCDLELRRPAPSYTIDTIRTFHEQLGATSELFFVLGADALTEIGRWRETAAILSLARIIAVARPGTTLDPAALEAEVPGFAERTIILTGPALEISSSDLRRRLAEGRPVRYQLPEQVWAYIQQQGLYQAHDSD